MVNDAVNKENMQTTMFAQLRLGTVQQHATRCSRCTPACAARSGQDAPPAPRRPPAGQWRRQRRRPPLERAAAARPPVPRRCPPARRRCPPAPGCPSRPLTQAPAEWGMIFIHLIADGSRASALRCQPGIVVSRPWAVTITTSHIFLQAALELIVLPKWAIVWQLSRNTTWQMVEPNARCAAANVWLGIDWTKSQQQPTCSSRSMCCRGLAWTSAACSYAVTAAKRCLSASGVTAAAPAAGVCCAAAAKASQLRPPESGCACNVGPRICIGRAVIRWHVAGTLRHCCEDSAVSLMVALSMMIWRCTCWPQNSLAGAACHRTSHLMESRYKATSQVEHLPLRPLRAGCWLRGGLRTASRSRTPASCPAPRPASPRCSRAAWDTSAEPAQGTNPKFDLGNKSRATNFCAAVQQGAAQDAKMDTDTSHARP